MAFHRACSRQSCPNIDDIRLLPDRLPTIVCAASCLSDQPLALAHCDSCRSQPQNQSKQYAGRDCFVATKKEEVRAFALLKMVREGEAPAEPQTMESILLLAAQQELRPPEDCPILKQAKKPWRGDSPESSRCFESLTSESAHSRQRQRSRRPLFNTYFPDFLHIPFDTGFTFLLI